eukprot:496929_1
MTTTILTFRLLFTQTILLHIASTCNDENTCHFNLFNDHIDYKQHILSLPLNYSCENTYTENQDDCAYWKKHGECENEPGYMTFNCAKECGYCHLRDPKTRCRRHPEAKRAVFPNDINKMFERILTDFPQYTPQVLSKDPWLVVLNNVFSDEECDTLIDLGGRDWQRSADAGDMSDTGDEFESLIYDGRTSYSDWCIDDGCWQNPIINNMAKIAENITMIPKENTEFFQMLRYEVGQYYNEHHDYIPGHLDLPVGPRIYTFFIYLNTPEEGGATRFTDIDKVVEAKKGSVAIWSSVLNDDPFQMEQKTNHEALPVTKGIKYAANLWTHMYNFHGPYHLMCTG